MDGKKKTIYDLEIHETLLIEEVVVTDSTDDRGVQKKYEVTRVPGGFVYSFKYPGWRQNQNVFVPFTFDHGYVDVAKNMGLVENKK